MFETLGAAIPLVLDPQTLLVVVLCSAFGLFVGAIPGLSATMATAMLVPLTFFMDPVPAIAAIVTTAAMAIFASDIPAALVRIPGTAASAAYLHELHALTEKGQVGRALGISVACASIGGIIGSMILIVAAPQLAEVSLQFTSFEYFWLALLGLSAAVMLGKGSLTRSFVSLLIGLFISTIGLDTSSGFPRFTFGIDALLGGVSFVPALIGMFAVPEILRAILSTQRATTPPRTRGIHLFKGLGGVLWRYKANLIRGSLVGTAIGILPGAGSDIGSWISYAISKKFSRHPEAYGSGCEEGLVDATSANNAALSGAYVPAMVFGIPGDSITAIVIGVLYVKGLNPGPLVFINNADQVTAIFLVFILANLLIIPFGMAAIALGAQVLRVPKTALAPLILVFCIVGSFAIESDASGIVIMLTLGLLAYVMEENQFPIAPAILGIVMGLLVERNLIKSLIKSDDNPLMFFERPIAAGLGLLVIVVWGTPFVLAALRKIRGTGNGA